MPSDTESVTHHSVQSDPDPDNAKHKAHHRAGMRRHRARRGKGMECLVIRVNWFRARSLSGRRLPRSGEARRSRGHILVQYHVAPLCCLRCHPTRSFLRWAKWYPHFLLSDRLRYPTTSSQNQGYVRL